MLVGNVGMVFENIGKRKLAEVNEGIFDGKCMGMNR